MPTPSSSRHGGCLPCQHKGSSDICRSKPGQCLDQKTFNANSSVAIVVTIPIWMIWPRSTWDTQAEATGTPYIQSKPSSTDPGNVLIWRMVRTRAHKFPPMNHRAKPPPYTSNMCGAHKMQSRRSCGLSTLNVCRAKYVQRL